eukprot:38104_1
MAYSALAVHVFLLIPPSSGQCTGVYHENRCACAGTIYCQDAEESYPPCHIACDGIIDCVNGEDEAEELQCGKYHCEYNYGELDPGSIALQYSADASAMAGWGTWDLEESTRVTAEGMETAKAFGIDLGNNLALLCLLFMNIITAALIISGLYHYQITIGFHDINIHYITTIIILSQHLLLTTFNMFRFPFVSCYIGYNEVDVRPSWLDIVLWCLSAILWLIWCHYSYDNDDTIRVQYGNKTHCRFGIVVVISIAAVFSSILLSIAGSVNYFFLLFLGYNMTQIAIPYTWVLLIMEDYDKMHWKCKSKICGISQCSACSGLLWCSCFFMLVVYGFFQWNASVEYAYTIFGKKTYYPYGFGTHIDWNWCLMFSGNLWLSPLFVILNVIALFSDAKFPAIAHNIIILIISVFGINAEVTQSAFAMMLCYYIINIQFIVHALCIPIYITIIFYSFKELKSWKTDIISMYLVMFDIATDCFVIYQFIIASDYIFAVLLIAFILLGQIFGTFATDFVGQTKAQYLTKGDKILTFIGLSGSWFIIKSWSYPKYIKLARRHKVWAIMFENMPSVALQLYALLTTNVSSTSLTLSISLIVSVCTITFSAWFYLVKLGINDDDLTINDDPNDGIQLQVQTPQKSSTVGNLKQKFSHVLRQKQFYFGLYGFMMSDFYVRSVPLIILLSLLPCNEQEMFCGLRIGVGCAAIVGLLVFEFIMNKRMRIKDYQTNMFIVSIFSISVLSSFFTVLSSLELLKDNPLFGKSVDFKYFVVEHKTRIVCSVVLSIVNIILWAMTSKTISVIVLILIFFIALLANYFTTKVIQKYVDPSDDLE